MTVLVTGAAGFIGYHTALALLERGQAVVGIDSLNDYYDVSLKEARLAQLSGQDGFAFERCDMADRNALDAVFAKYPQISGIVHLAAQPGVRYSLVNPHSYTRNNVEAHLNLLEGARALEGLDHLVFASSSSVYGANSTVPYATDQKTDRPVSLYAATKKSQELMGHAYAHLYRIPQTGLRFFTVYGPWGRPDMAPMIFTRKILAGDPIPVFNDGNMRRDFTYIDDIVAGVLGCLDRPPEDSGEMAPPFAVYNIGNNRSEKLMDFIAALEGALGVKAEIDFQPMQPGDVKETYADIDATKQDFGFQPATDIATGVGHFVRWYRDYYGV